MGTAIDYKDGVLIVPDDPIIPVIPGDGIGPDVWNACKAVLETAVHKVYQGKRRIEWLEKLAGQTAYDALGTNLPDDTLDAIKTYRVAIKGPLGTPVGKGFRSVNVALRRLLDLYVCMRPVSYLPGMPSPVRHPERVNMTIFRENTEDVYAGIEWPAGSPEAAKVMDLVKTLAQRDLRADSGIGIKPMSETGSKRLVRRAIEYALAHKLPSVTLVHKGNIMKFTEGAFRQWGYDVAAEEFADVTITEARLKEQGGVLPEGKIVIKDRIADAMFQEILLRPEQYHVLALPNLNGDYISDALAAEVGGLGMAPGSNIGDGFAIFEATHGTAPTIAGQDRANPGSIILSGALMLDYLGWTEAGDRVRQAVQKAVTSGKVTEDLSSQMPGTQTVSCSAFGKIIEAQI